MTSERSWLDDAPLDHLPYAATSAGVVVRVAGHALDLAAAARATRPDLVRLVEPARLNPLLAAGPAAWAEVRAWVTDLLADPAYAGQLVLRPVDQVTLRLPFEVADYVDYYASEHHASNVSRILRPDDEPLLPNWKRLPVGYHGRSGSVVVSGTAIHRPSGQLGPDRFEPTERLDIEAELGFVVGRSVPLGQRVGTGELGDTVFGVVGLNDWSARDIQAWEYRPLGPNLGKSFATTISAWVTPLAALEHARVDLPGQQPPVLPYLRVDEPAGYDIDVEIVLNDTVVATAPYRSTYWSPAQMLAHLTVNGASLRVGDLFASGTISGPDPGQRGSLLELSWGGEQSLETAAGPRTFLEDGDEVVLRYSAPGPSGRITLGEVRGRVLPAL